MIKAYKISQIYAYAIIQQIPCWLCLRLPEIQPDKAAAFYKKVLKDDPDAAKDLGCFLDVVSEDLFLEDLQKEESEKGPETGRGADALDNGGGAVAAGPGAQAQIEPTCQPNQDGRDWLDDVAAEIAAEVAAEAAANGPELEDAVREVVVEEMAASDEAPAPAPAPPLAPGLDGLPREVARPRGYSRRTVHHHKSFEYGRFSIRYRDDRLPHCWYALCPVHLHCTKSIQTNQPDELTALRRLLTWCTRADEFTDKTAPWTWPWPRRDS